VSLSAGGLERIEGLRERSRGSSAQNSLSMQRRESRSFERKERERKGEESSEERREMRILETCDWKCSSESSSSCGVGSREAIWCRRKLRRPRNPVEADGGSPVIAMDVEKSIGTPEEREQRAGEMKGLVEFGVL
jgi:hypothetical protein